MSWGQFKSWGRGTGLVGNIAREGKFFTVDGKPFTVIETSDFSLYKRYLQNESRVEEVMRERAELGFNTLRVWLLNSSVVSFRNYDFGSKQGPIDTGIHPDQHTDFYEKLAPFAKLARSYGFIVEFTIFSSTGTLMPNKQDQQAHLTFTTQATRRLGNVLLELVNEGDQYDNAPHPDLNWPFYADGPLLSRGSNGSDSVPPDHDRPLDYELYHTNDQPEFQRKVGHNAMEWADESGRPCVSNENTRFTDKDNSPIHAYDAAMGAALLCAGSCYHSSGGKYSLPFSAAERICAKAWTDGAKSVPLEFQRGTYIRRDDLNGPNCIRAYEKRLPDGRSYIIRIRP